jgi:NAD(P)-dependent dehydrogenase (short-subunit alcohol dehydrogenase family)
MLIVMTTRGLGLVAARSLKASGTKIMGARNLSEVPERWLGLALDLSRLNSVRAFVAALPEEQISHLILNAGGQAPTAKNRTEDGFETTFATNHLAHYLMLRLLMPRLAPGARIVITSSGTHDPREKTGVPPPRHADAYRLAYPERETSPEESDLKEGMRAYSTSKLCNVMTALFLAQTQEAQKQGWRVFAYDPGATPGTGLVRHHSWAIRNLIWPVLPLMVPFSSAFNTMQAAGQGLAELAETAIAPDGHVYASLRRARLTWPAPSTIAQDQATRAKLWNQSAELVEP